MSICAHEMPLSGDQSLVVLCFRFHGARVLTKPAWPILMFLTNWMFSVQQNSEEADSGRVQPAQFSALKMLEHQPTGTQMVQVWAGLRCSMDIFASWEPDYEHDQQTQKLNEIDR